MTPPARRQAYLQNLT